MLVFLLATAHASPADSARNARHAAATVPNGLSHIASINEIDTRCRLITRRNQTNDRCPGEGSFWRGTPSQRPRSYFHSIRIFLLVLLFSVIFSFPKKEILKFMTRIRQFRRFLYHDVTLVTEQLYLCFYILVGYFYGQGETMC